MLTQSRCRSHDWTDSEDSFDVFLGLESQAKYKVTELKVVICWNIYYAALNATDYFLLSLLSWNRYRATCVAALSAPIRRGLLLRE